MKLKDILKVFGVLLLRTFYILCLLLLYPVYYLFNKYDFNKKVKKNPLYISKYVRIADKYPLIYDISLYLLNFPKPTKVYNILPDIKGKVLQVGCGTGLLNRYLRNKYDVELINLDVNIKSLNFGISRKRFSTFIHADINRVPLEEKQFDVIIFARSFHHIRNHRKAFIECARLIKDDGIIIVTDPISLQGDNSVGSMRNGYMANSSFDGVIWRFSKETFEKHLKESLPKDLIIKSIEFKRQLHMTNYNLKYPQTDVLATIRKV